MDKCKYSQLLKCESCNVVYYSQCAKFVKAHYLYLNRDILPFVYKKTETSDNVLWSKDENKIKSAAATRAIVSNAVVKKLSISQVISAVLSNIEFDNKIIYIEYKQKLQGDADKIKSCLVSFIENSSMVGSFVYIFISPSVPCSLDYNKI